MWSCEIIYFRGIQVTRYGHGLACTSEYAVARVHASMDDSRVGGCMNVYVYVSGRRAVGLLRDCMGICVEQCNNNMKPLLLLVVDTSGQ